jgi:hypothetical protein
VIEAAFDLLAGHLLETEQFELWLALNVVLATLGTIFLALFYYLDYRKAPRAPALSAFPSMNSLTRAHSKLQLWMDELQADQLRFGSSNEPGQRSPRSSAPSTPTPPRRSTSLASLAEE